MGMTVINETYLPPYGGFQTRAVGLRHGSMLLLLSGDSTASLAWLG